MGRGDEPQQAWLFRFGLERRDGERFPHQVAEELMAVIVAWAEARGLQVGGGFAPPPPDEEA